MTEAMVAYGMDRKIQVSEEQKGLVKSIVFPNCTDDELRLYLFECDRRGVHPLDRLIFPIKRNDGGGGTRVTFQCSVDYLRAEAADTGEYDGQDEPVFGTTGADGYPESATVSVYKKGVDRPLTGTARWKEYYPGEKLGFMWRKMPFHMLAKCAEVLALRKAFPKRLAGLYVPEEMQSVDAGEGKARLKEPQKKTPAEQPKVPESFAGKEVKDPAAPSTENQQKAIHAILSKSGIGDFEGTEKVSRLAGIPGDAVIVSTRELTKGQASTVIKALSEEFDKK
jgi:phage recombination protein Bet